MIALGGASQTRMHFTRRIRTAVMLVAALTLPGGVFAGSNVARKCVKAGEQLHLNTLRATVTDDMLKASFYLAAEVPDRCLKEEVMIPREDSEISVGTITALFGRLCQKSPSPKAAEYFIRYRLMNANSADEEFQLVLERVFVSKPTATMAYIKGQPDTTRTMLLDDIVWGFLSNRIYGPIDPFEGRSVHRVMPGETMPPEVLNRRTYRQVFQRLSPHMESALQEFPAETNYVLDQIRKYLETWGVEY